MGDARAAADLVDGLVGGVEDDTGAELAGECDLLFTGELPLLDFVGQVGVEEGVCYRVTNGGRGRCDGRQQRRRLETQRTLAKTRGDVVRGDAVLASSAALDVLGGDGVVVLIYTVDGAGALGKPETFKCGKVLLRREEGDV